MRWIEKKHAPPELTAWQAKYRTTDPNYGYALMRQDEDVRTAVLNSLIAEQGELCAYTGIRIKADGCHIEHVMPQSHCTPANGLAGLDVDYRNMVACYPKPNTAHAPFGAHPKANWPSPSERTLFVSPLDRGCEERFLFRRNGKMLPANSADAAAAETIRHLRLSEDDETKPAHQLVSQRKAAIQATLKNDSLPLPAARRRLQGLEEAERAGHRLEPYCFALKQVLTAHIRRVEFIRASQAKK